VRDGGAITLRAFVTAPGGGQTSVPLTLTPGQGGGFGWSYAPSGPAGSYLVSISATDQAGNASAQGPFVVQVAETTTPTSTPSATATSTPTPSATPTTTPGAQGATVLVRHAPTLNSNARVEGSLWLLAGEAMTLNGSAAIAGDLLVPGSPAVTLNGSASIGSTVAGSGSAQPAGYRITLNGSSRVNRLVTRTDPLTVPAVPAPPAPTGTRNVVINQPGQSIGDPATIRNLTLNGNAGAVAVPPGTYGQWTAHGSARFVIGVAGAATPSVYNLQGLTLNSSSRLEIVGPVTLNVGSGMSWNGMTGSSANPHWLTVNVATGAVRLNSSSTLYGTLRAPSSTVTLNSSARLIGSVIADRLTLNSSAVIQAAP
jgi:rhamnogalacturonan endolyase